MATNKMRNEDYETQFFEFSPSAFFEEVKAIINDRLCEGIDQLEKQLKRIPKSVLSPDEVTQGIETLRQHTESNYSKTVQKLESHILGNLMKIPPHILLPSDVEQATQITATDITLLQAEIDSLHEQLKNEKYMECKYKEEMEEIKEVLDQQHKLRSGTLSKAQIERAEDLKEKLLFIKENENDTKLACDKAQQAMESISLRNIPIPAYLISEQSLK